MKVEMTDLRRQYQALGNEIQEQILHTASSGKYIGGEEVILFASELATYLSAEFAVPVGNGTDALEIAFLSLGLEPGDEIIIPTHNYVAAAEAAVRLGLIPVWADLSDRITGQTFNLSADESYLDSLLSSRTRALVGVNLYGFPIEAEKLSTFCQKRELFFIEDNAQGIGGSLLTYQGERKMGRFGDISTTSFFPTKPLGAMGDGGAIITSNPELAERARRLANHGQSRKYDYTLVGKNSRLDALQASILRLKLRHLDQWILQTQQIAQRYHEALSKMAITCPLTSPNQSPTYHQYTVILPEGIEREAVRSRLIECGVASQLYYPEPLHQTKLYSQLGIQRGSLDRSEYISQHMLSLPIHPFLLPEEQDYVIHCLETILND